MTLGSITLDFCSSRRDRSLSDRMSEAFEEANQGLPSRTACCPNLGHTSGDPGSGG